MKLFDREHYQLMEQFEKNYKGCFRLDKEEKSLWPKGIIYEHPEANALFLAFRLGVALGMERNLPGERHEDRKGKTC